MSAELPASLLLATRKPKSKVRQHSRSTIDSPQTPLRNSASESTHHGANAKTERTPNKHPAPGTYRALVPNYDEFAKLLEGLCQLDFNAILGHVSVDHMQAFSVAYQQHITYLLRIVCERDFVSVENALYLFWRQLPREFTVCLRCDEGVRLVANADDYLYQVVVNTLTGDVLESVPISVTQSIRQFAKSLEVWLSQSFEISVPQAVVELKLDLARRCAHILRRRTSLNHLAQAVRSILHNPEYVGQMIHDWAHIDFASIKEQALWIVRTKESLLTYVESSFRSYLLEGLPLLQWLQWLESLLEQCLAIEMGSGETLEHAARSVILRWSFFSAMVLRDLTLRSANSFGTGDIAADA